MTNSFSSGKGKLVEPSFGSYVDSWNQPVNSNFGLTDALVSGTTTIDVSSATTTAPYITLVFNDYNTTTTPWTSPLAAQNLRLVLTGLIPVDMSIYIPSGRPGMWLIDIRRVEQRNYL